VSWLIEQSWVRKDGQSIILRKRDYELIADSWCAKALDLAINLANDNRMFSIPDWQNGCENIFAPQPNLSSERKFEKCREFLQEFSDCGYLVGKANISDPVAELNLGQFNEDSFYLEIAKDANLRRPFDLRKARRH